ncbi:MAG: deoxyribodipyrimidine photo-lyase, partial [Bacteroidales bacterium]|nr:deoxyribodipyrimidine photo-lyase [Bacteroidales bacterium]
MNTNPQRIKTTGPGVYRQGTVVYWMSRDQRSEDNWGLVYAHELSRKFKTEMAVVFCLATKFLEATERHYDFMFKGLQEVEKDLRHKNIPFYMLMGDPVEKLNEFLKTHQAEHLVYDFDPLRIKQEWQQKLLENRNLSFYEVDSHNIVPARNVSDKREFGAYTLRPKIHRKLEFFLDEFPEIESQGNLSVFRFREANWEMAFSSLTINRGVKAVHWLKPGQKEAKDMLEKFRFQKLAGYAELRNDPNKDASSNLSPYLHFGQISAQRVALEMIKNHEKNPDTDSFLEELIVRRELSDNYCLYNSSYDNLSSIPEWAAKTLEAHRKDEREY